MRKSYILLGLSFILLLCRMFFMSYHVMMGESLVPRSLLMLSFWLTLFFFLLGIILIKKGH